MTLPRRKLVALAMCHVLRLSGAPAGGGICGYGALCVHHHYPPKIWVPLVRSALSRQTCQALVIIYIG